MISQIIGLISVTHKVTKKVCKRKKEKKIEPLVVRKTVINPKPKKIIYARRRSNSI